MPVMLYQTFMQQLELAFQQIAQVSVQITTNQTTFTEEQLTDYWQLALLNSQCNTPLVQKVLKHRHHNLKIGKLSYLLIMKQLFLIWSNNIYQLLRNFISLTGFLNFILNQNGSTASCRSAEKIWRAKLEQAAAFQQQAAESLVKHEQMKKKTTTSACVWWSNSFRSEYSQWWTHYANGKHTGRRTSDNDWRLYFDKEVRELRSKRKILILKITDYTSSFVVKKFSNGEKDEQVLMRFNRKVGFVFVVVYKKIPSCVI